MKSNMSLNLFLCSLFLICSSAAQAKKLNTLSDNYSHISVTIKMKKNVFKVGEPIEGDFVLENDYPATLPAVFNVKLYRGNTLITSRTTAIKTIPTGKTEFSFKSFAIPQFNRRPESQGVWRLTILQQNVLPSETQEVTIEIIPGKSPKLQKEK